MADKNVTVYTERSYQGRSQTLKPGAYDASELKEGEDTVSSVRVPDGWTVCLYEDPEFKGRSKLLTSSTDHVGDDFNNITSSLIIADPSATEDFVDIDPNSLIRLTQGSPPRYEQIMVLNFTMAVGSSTSRDAAKVSPEPAMSGSRLGGWTERRGLSRHSGLLPFIPGEYNSSLLNWEIFMRQVPRTLIDHLD